MQTQDADGLITRVQAGDESFYALAEVFEPIVRRYIVARCSYWASTDDLVQKVFLYLHEHISDYKAGSNPTAWVVSISKIVVLHKIRREQRRADAHERYVDSMLATHDAESCEDEHLDMKLSALKDCLGDLRDDHRRLVEMQYYARMPLEAIRRELSKTLSWVKVTLFRIKKALHDCVQERLVAEMAVDNG